MNIRPLIVVRSIVPPEPPTPTFPSDMDFIYLANDFDGTKIPNIVPNSTFGDYLQYGTLVKNGSGSSCYLSKYSSSSNDGLYKELTTTELANIQAVNSTYTFFIRMMQDVSSGVGSGLTPQIKGLLLTITGLLFNIIICLPYILNLQHLY